MDIGTLIVFWLICAVIAAAIGQRKNRSAVQSFMIGAVLGIIGIAIVIVQKPGLPKAPTGMRAERCPRCNAVQNIGITQLTYECWQCAAKVKASATPGQRAAGVPAAGAKTAQNTPTPATKKARGAPQSDQKEPAKTETTRMALEAEAQAAEAEAEAAEARARAIRLRRQAGSNDFPGMH